MSRKKLCKLLGKDLQYTATFASYKDSTAVLTNLKYKNKLLCDHVCVSYHYALSKLEVGTEVTFNATAITYTDSKGERKNGLSKCYKYYRSNGVYDAVKQDNAQKRKRNMK